MDDELGRLQVMIAIDPCLVVGCTLEYGHDGKHAINETRRERTARIFGCTVEQASAQFFANAAGLRAMERTARSIGVMVNGYTADQLAAMAEDAMAAAKGER